MGGKNDLNTNLQIIYFQQFFESIDPKSEFNTNEDLEEYLYNKSLEIQPKGLETPTSEVKPKHNSSTLRSPGIKPPKPGNHYSANHPLGLHLHSQHSHSAPHGMSHQSNTVPSTPVTAHETKRSLSQNQEESQFAMVDVRYDRKGTHQKIRKFQGTISMLSHVESYLRGSISKFRKESVNTIIFFPTKKERQIRNTITLMIEVVDTQSERTQSVVSTVPLGHHIFSIFSFSFRVRRLLKENSKRPLENHELFIPQTKRKQLATVITFARFERSAPISFTSSSSTPRPHCVLLTSHAFWGK